MGREDGALSGGQGDGEGGKREGEEFAGKLEGERSWRVKEGAAMHQLWCLFGVERELLGERRRVAGEKVARRAEEGGLRKRVVGSRVGIARVAVCLSLFFCSSVCLWVSLSLV